MTEALFSEPHDLIRLKDFGITEESVVVVDTEEKLEAAITALRKEKTIGMDAEYRADKFTKKQKTLISIF